MMPAERGYDVLEWDSSVFGFTVARVAAPDDAGTLAFTLDDARRHGVRLLYLQTDTSELIRAAESQGATPVGERITYARAVTEADVRMLRGTNSPVAVERWPGTTPTPELQQLARDAGQHSRFRIDPEVPDGVFERIYDAWIARSLDRQIAEDVLVTRDATSISGLVTVGRKDGRADIGLLSVRSDARGRGVGKALVLAAPASCAEAATGVLSRSVWQQCRVAA